MWDYFTCISAEVQNMTFEIKNTRNDFHGIEYLLYI